MLVRDGRWWSYDCPDLCCAPGAGTPLPAGVTELEVASIATGSVVEPDRDALQARIARPEGRDRGAMAAACARVAVECSAAVLDTGIEAVAAQSWAAVSDAAARCGPGATGRLTDDEVARVVWGLRDGEVRDLAMGLALGPERAAAEQLWTECTRAPRSPWTRHRRRCWPCAPGSAATVPWPTSPWPGRSTANPATGSPACSPRPWRRALPARPPRVADRGQRSVGLT